MQMCKGMLVVVDSSATVFNRIWWGFEQATVVQGKKLLLDFVTVHSGAPQLLTEGFAYVLPQILIGQKRPSSPCWRQIDPLRFHAAHLTMPRPGPCRLAEVLTRNFTSC